jgi:hypothetical protein
MTDDNLKTLLDRHAAFWSRAPVDRPLLNTSTQSEESRYDLTGLNITLADGTTLSVQDEPLTPDMMDPTLMLDVQEFPNGALARVSDGTQVVDDLLVTRAPLTKMTWVEAIMGCPVIPKLDTGSIYSAPYLESAGQASNIPPPEESPWLSLLQDYTRALVENSGGSYQVVQCLQRGPIDLVSALMGHSEMCYAIADEPVELHALSELCAETFVTVARAQEAIIPELEGGRCTPFGVWAPGTFVRTQCDVTSSVSAKMYEEVFFPYDVQICQQFDYSAVHLHSGYLHTIDVFLKDKYPTAVQVSLDTGSTPYTVHDLIPVFARVLEVKPLFIQGRLTASELDELLEKLPPRGLMVSTTIPDEE